MNKFFLLISFISITMACQRDNEVGPTQIEVFDPLPRMVAVLEFSTEADFWVSSTIRTFASDIQPFDLSRGNAIIQAGYEEEINQGTFLVSNDTLYYNEGIYRLGETIPLADLVGQNNTFSFYGNGGSIPSFSMGKYIPEQTDLTISGLVEGRRPVEGGDISIAWNPDFQFPSYGKAAVFFFSTKSEELVFKHHFVDDKDGVLQLSSTFLNDFSGDEIVNILYLKAYQDLEIITDKSIDFQFISYSDVRLRFEE